MPAELGREDVQRVARLARLRLSGEETARFAEQLRRILAYAEQVRQVDTAGVPPTTHPFGDDPTLRQLREDEPGPSLTAAQALTNAPEADPASGLFKVPRVL